MNEDTNLQRLIYYKGQLLTAQDFEDQQKYHKQKLEQLTQRFPNGIVRGLKVIFSKNSDGSEALKILGGLAIDSDGKAIVVPEEGILVPVPNGLEKPFLSLKYTESKSRRNLSPLEPTKPFDRIVETVEPVWAKNANISDEEEACITVAKLRAKTEADKTLPPEVLGSNYVIEGEDDPTIRLDAGLIGLNQLKDEVKDSLVTNDIKQKLVTNGDSHDHSGGDGKSISLGGLAQEVKDQLVTNDIKQKLVTNGDSHDHSGGDGSSISLNGLAPDVKGKLVTVINEIFTASSSPFKKEKSFPDQKLRIPNIIPMASNTKIQWSYDVEALPGPQTKFTFTIKVIIDSGNNICRLDFIEIGA